MNTKKQKKYNFCLFFRELAVVVGAAVKICLESRRSAGQAAKKVPCNSESAGNCNVFSVSQNRIRSSMYWRTSLMGTRTCSMVSRSRMVTVWVSSVSKSTQMLKGVPISSCRR